HLLYFPTRRSSDLNNRPRWRPSRLRRTNHERRTAFSGYAAGGVRLWRRPFYRRRHHLALGQGRFSLPGRSQRLRQDDIAQARGRIARTAVGKHPAIGWHASLARATTGLYVPGPHAAVVATGHRQRFAARIAA